MVAVTDLAQQLIERLKTEEFFRVPASEEEYLDIAPGFPGKLEYQNGEIIAMSVATALHELIVSSVNFLLYSYFRNKDFLMTSSNAGLQILKPDGSYYQPDLMVTQGQWLFKKGSKCIITNPYLLVEVLSKSTNKYDQGDKLSDYKDIPSLQFIVYVWQDRPYISVYERTENPNVWINTDYKTLDSTARLGDLNLPLNEVYHKIPMSESAKE